MLNWLVKFKISNALNQGERLSPFWRKRIMQSLALEDFQQSAAALDQGLKTRRNLSGPSLPPDLHTSIMSAVKTESSLKLAESARLSRRHGSSLVRWGLAPACLLVLAGGIFWLIQRPSRFSPPAQTAAAVATPSHPWTLAGQAVTNAPALLTAPLTQETENILKDFRATTQFLLASLP